MTTKLQPSTCSELYSLSSRMVPGRTWWMGKIQQFWCCYPCAADVLCTRNDNFLC